MKMRPMRSTALRLLVWAAAAAAAPAIGAHGSHAPATPSGPQIAPAERPAQPAATTAAQRDERARQYFTDSPLVATDGRRLRFYSDVLRERLVLVSFIYTTCADACPMITHNLTLVKRELGEAFGRDVRFVTLSIDPERDTPAEMARFAAKYSATHPEWLFLTGAKPDMERVLKKLGAFTSDPASHFTGMYIGNLREDRWRKVRPDTAPAAIAAELRAMLLAPVAVAR